MLQKDALTELRMGRDTRNHADAEGVGDSVDTWRARISRMADSVLQGRAPVGLVFHAPDLAVH